MGIDILVGAFLHDLQHQLRQAEEFQSRPIQWLVRIAIDRTKPAVKPLARKFSYLHGIVPVDAEDHALGLDFVLYLLGFAGIVLESGHGAAFLVDFAALGLVGAMAAVGTGRFAR